MKHAAWLVFMILLSRGSATATISIGLYDFGAGSALLDHLIVMRGLDATYTRYNPASFNSVNDFSVHDVWFVPSAGSSGTYGGLRSNPTFQAGTAFSRLVITGTDPDVHYPSHEGASQFMLNAIRWAGGGVRQATGVMDKHGASPGGREGQALQPFPEGADGDVKAFGRRRAVDANALAQVYHLGQSLTFQRIFLAGVA